MEIFSETLKVPGDLSIKMKSFFELGNHSML